MFQIPKAKRSRSVRKALFHAGSQLPEPAELQKLVDALGAGSRNMDAVWLAVGIAPTGVTMPEAPAEAPAEPEAAEAAPAEEEKAEKKAAPAKKAAGKKAAGKKAKK